MRRFLMAALAALLLGSAAAEAQSVPTYHADAARSGRYIVPGLDDAHARGAHLDPDFRAEFAGHLYAQPLYRQGRLYVATEDDSVHALDARDGHEIWHRVLGRPVPLTDLPCGNIDPLGITGTPVIDEHSGALYLDAVVAEDGVMHHRVFALSLDDGSVLPGWPLDVGTALAAKGETFAPRYQNQRGALVLLANRVYVPFGGHFGDCGDYHGWVVGIGLAAPHDVVAWHTRAAGGGIWAPGGLVSDGRSLYVATGNTMGAANWGDGEAIIRLAPDLARDERPESYFAPSNWRGLDVRDADLGGTNPSLLDLPGAVAAMVLALGKDGRAYLLDHNRLGGIGGQLLDMAAASRAIITAPAVYPAPDGAYVAFRAPGAQCPAGGGAGVTVLRIASGPPPLMTTAWCAALSGAGSAMVTTTNGRADPIVWILGAEGDERLHAFRGDTGEPLYTSERLAGLRHFATPIAADGRIYVGADGRLYAFAF